ncbi:dUTP diphosphatase [Pseudodesulfovibrio sp. F-1]|uniref:dUTP diphosphatase n=1 Tax=Pseudodesulfovibrio alkaliphilus TaxID=2661613 RepID=A0A7K1KQ63_9BACT|nr:dUTP diphosphatase [Pseudodesulfovibrio alkaliphilus]MUM78234.1 dUTP diphosphatase [Pseudodesulfovibrio alkaliphilus]
MKKIDVNVEFLHPVWEEHRLAYATELSAGLDLRACIDGDELEFGPGEKKTVPAGLAIEIREPGVAGYVFSRSGLGTREGLTVSQGVGVIDPDYRGEIKVSLLNTSGEVRRIRRGQRIAQLVFMPVFQAVVTAVRELGATDRGAGGFGSTGKL